MNTILLRQFQDGSANIKIDGEELALMTLLTLAYHSNPEFLEMVRKSLETYDRHTLEIDQLIIANSTINPN